MSDDAKKKIFISDIHMGDDRSFKGDYGWFLGDNISNLAEFLGGFKGSEVEVVILGDLFDTWVIPVDEDPLPDFQAIVACDGNKKVITALKDLAAKHKLTYIPGNHDMPMPVSDAEQNLTRNFLETTFPGINYDPHDNGKYENGTIVGEHGHRHDLYNAPDVDYYLPIGYFISRVAAYKVAKEGKAKEDFHGIFKGFLKAYEGSHDFIHNLFVGIAEDAGLNTTSAINMEGIAGFEFSPTVGDIGTKYQDISKKWQNPRDNIHSDFLVELFGGVGDLALAASHVHLRPPGSKQNIAIFGHNHNYEMWADFWFTDRLLKTLPVVGKDSPSDLIYVNCGTWVDSKDHCTYVETEENIAEKRHYVRLLEYPGPKLLKQRFVEL